ncbi:MAG: hypothetical protein J5I93_28240 [Pirellulaceae bacterium]|nr:hypothetical protein [Pirellulaceae bacterium]
MVQFVALRPFQVVVFGWGLSLLALGLWPAGAAADDPTVERPAASQPGSSHALIVVGLPGDDAHRQLFDDIQRRWVAWLTGPAGFDPERITILSGAERRANDARQPEPAAGGSPPNKAAEPNETTEPDKAAEPAQPRRRPGTRDELETVARELTERLRPEDRLWVLTLGHANHDGRRAYLHLPGPDVDDRTWGLLFEKLGCREQIFWLTTSCAGWFVDRSSREGRIVIAATAADMEYNETEFPLALCRVAERPAAELDGDGDGRVSVRELFGAAVAEVTAIFTADKRAPTEHAQLDDNGDRRGTEWDQLTDSDAPPADAAQRPDDGQLAAKTYVLQDGGTPATSDASQTKN